MRKPHDKPILALALVLCTLVPTLSRAQAGTTADTTRQQSEAAVIVPRMQLTVQPQLANEKEVARAKAAYYPTLLRDAGVTGSATVRLRIDSTGRVDPRHITVVDATADLFREAAERVARRMRFTPAELNGVAVATQITLPIDFQL